MPSIALIWHSGYGHTEKVARLVAEGIRQEGGVELTVYEAGEAAGKLDEIGRADMQVWGTPTYMGGPSAGFKTYADATSKPWMQREWVGKFAAGFTNSLSLSGDKQGTLLYLATLAAQQGMIWIPMGDAGPAKDSGHGGKPEDINRVGAYLGLMTQSDNADPEHTPSRGDIETARRFGAHLARTLKRLAG